MTPELQPPDDGDLVAWMLRAFDADLIPCIVPVEVSGHPGIAHAAFTDHGGPFELGANH